MPNWRRGKSGHVKNNNSIVPEDYEEHFIDLEDEVGRNHKECSKEFGNTNGFRNALQDIQEE